MTTLQEQFERDFPDKEVKEITADGKYRNSNFTNYDLDLSKYVDLQTLELDGNKITSIKLFQNNRLYKLTLRTNNLTSVVFLDDFLNSKRLEKLKIYNNNIQSTDIEVFSRFVNLRSLKIGTTFGSDRRNKFYGSLKSYKNLTKLKEICIEATDVDSGLEYLPLNLVERTKEKSYSYIECSPHNIQAKCSVIQNQLRPFDYDVGAWQLAHPAEMFRARPEMFADENSKEKWLNALNNKIEKTNNKLKEIKQNNPDGIKKIRRLNTKLGELNTIKQLLEERSIFEDSLKTQDQWYKRLGVKKEDKATQTEFSVQFLDKK